MIDPTLADSHSPDLAALAVAKHPRTPLSGPYGHPIHPGLVAIPIGTWIASIIFDIESSSVRGPLARVSVRIPGGEISEGSLTGDGPIDAFFSALNAANRRFLLDNSQTFGGRHFADPRQVFAQVRYRFHY